MEFKNRYEKLNKAQKQAVETIDGPVMIVAGPGTGKTELLAMRAANILQKTDTSPENILCLTFTDSGASSMRKRLIDIIGQEAYKIAIHTFHSFGTEIINQNKEYFYNGATFNPADNIKNYEIISKLFENLDHKSLIKGQNNDEFTHLKDCLTVISEIKKSGLKTDELLAILNQNDRAIELLEPFFKQLFIGRPSKTTIVEALKLAPIINELPIEMGLFGKASLSEMIVYTFNQLITELSATNKPSTKPLTAWRNQWLENNDLGEKVFKSRKNQIKLRQVIELYQQYLEETTKAEVFDFDDMILHVIQAIEANDDLKFNLQEQFQYIMVDEFQDTNGAQMRIVKNLTDNIASDGQPNIMVVGDDDQAIYNFQGAELSNILDFMKLYPKTELITLTENYRSGGNILEGSRSVITQGINRLEKNIKKLDKNLNPNFSGPNQINLYQASDITSERYWIASNIKSLIEAGTKPEDIAILVRKNDEIKQMVPYLEQQGIRVNYAKQANALEQDIIILIEKIAQVIVNLADNNQDSVNAKLANILAHPVWMIEPTRIWQLSLSAYENHQKWLSLMSQDESLKPLYEWLIELASLVDNEPLESIIDIIIGNPNNKTTLKTAFVSPIYNHFFSEANLKQDPDKYLLFLEALRVIRDKTRQHYNNELPKLRDFIEFIRLSRKIDSAINLTDPDTDSLGKVKLMNAHKAKGMEFEIVYIANAVDSNWGEKAKKKSRLIKYPNNLKLDPAGDSDDERLRLFYVAMTRAKSQLKICYSQKNIKEKELFIVNFLSDSKIEKVNIKEAEDLQETIEAKEADWYQPIINLPANDIKELLTPHLENYKLSITHLQKFLNVKNGGPQAFLMENLLRFPQAKSAHASFGTAIHDALQFTHTYLKQHNKIPSQETVINRFIDCLKKQHLSQVDFDIMKKRGEETLGIFLKDKLRTLSTNQQVEVSFSSQNCMINNAHITGNLDLIEIDPIEKSITITDYKTGRALHEWFNKDDQLKIKLHHYKQQLMFYKLLIDSSRDYRKFEVKKGIMQFVEPDENDNIRSLEISFQEKDILEFKQLVKAVWDRIISLDLPDISNFSKSLKGIKDFEKSIVENK